jgi:hypothetical protein
MPQAQMDTPMPSQPPSQALECPLCEIPLTFLERIWDMRSSGYMRAFECPNCRKLTWDDDKGRLSSRPLLRMSSADPNGKSK